MQRQRLIHRLILSAAIVALLVPIVWIEHDILIQTRGTIAYPLDDAFINLTLAKNLAHPALESLRQWFATHLPRALGAAPAQEA